MITRLAALFLLLSMSNLAYGEVSIATKGGYIFFDEHRDSIYQDNHIYDNELSYGTYVRYIKKPYFVRLDYDTVKTGNEFASDTTPIPYEGVHVRLHNLILTGGWYSRDWLYGGFGIGIGMNKWKLYTFDIHPLSLKHNPTLILSAIVGVEKGIYKNLYLFSEVRYNYERQKLELSELGSLGSTKELDENLSNLSIWLGLGVKF